MEPPVRVRAGRRGWRCGLGGGKGSFRRLSQSGQVDCAVDGEYGGAIGEGWGLGTEAWVSVTTKVGDVDLFLERNQDN